jgi:DNA-binding CsgD family transcriptional regulator
MDTSPVVGSADLIGRTGELETALACYARAAAADPQVLLLSGAAGIGKTRLAKEICAQAVAGTASARVRIGESAPLVGAALPYGPFVAALDGQAEWLLADDDGTGDMLARRHRSFVRVLGLLGDLTASAPLVLLLEDLHWADESSREIMSFLTVRLRDQAVLLVGTLRDDELDQAATRWLAELERRPRVTRLRLTGLADAEIAEVVADLVPATAGAGKLPAIIAAAEGNPLYARELAAVGSDQPPPSITAAVLAKTAGLSPDARALIEQVCVAHGGLHHDVVAATVRLPEPDLLGCIREAVSAGLLVSDGDGYAFHHSLIQQVLYAELLPGERRRLHRLLAEALAAEPDADPAGLAQHWHLAGCPDRAAPAAAAAARQALAARAYPEAVRSFSLAIQLARWLAEPAAPLLAAAAQAASWAKEPRLAITWATAALAESTTAGLVDSARLLERLGRYHWEAGNPGAAVEATEQAVALLTAEPASVLQARVLAALATRRVFIGDYDKALPLAERAIEVASETGATAESARSLTALGIIRAQHGDPEASLMALAQAYALAREAGRVEDIVHAASNRMYLLCTLGRFGEALNLAREARRVALALNAPPGQLSIFGNNMAAVLVATGQWGEAERLLAELVTEASVNIERYLRLLQLELAVGRGDAGGVAELTALLATAPADPRLTGPLRACLAEHALNAGDLGAVAAEVAAGLDVLAGTDLVDDKIRLYAAGARLAADLSRLPPAAWPKELGASRGPLAADFAGQARAIVERHGADRPDLAAFGQLAAAEQARQHGTDSRAAWRAVAQAWRLAAQPYREAYARFREAEAAAAAGRRDQAARALAACESIARELPSPPLLALAGELAARARLTAPPAARPAGTPGRPAAAALAQFDLTEREGQVLGLLAEGRTNRQIGRALFISERTAAVHVSRILGKLSVPNRASAAAIGTRLGFAADQAPADLTARPTSTRIRRKE